MKSTSGGKSNRESRRLLQGELAPGEGTAALAPPDYGIDFVDRGVTSASAALPVQRVAEEAPNRTGLPDRVKAGIETLSGMDLSDVRVHANSSKPAALNAYAYTQGSDIHVAPGQEKHLAHEAWHVVQQRQGRVKPTMQMKGTPINDSAGLEHEADVMGERAAGLIDSNASRPLPEVSQRGVIPHANGCGCASCGQRAASGSDTIQAMAGVGGIGVVQLNCKHCGSAKHTNKNCPVGPTGNLNQQTAPPPTKKNKPTSHHQHKRPRKGAAKHRR